MGTTCRLQRFMYVGLAYHSSTLHTCVRWNIDWLGIIMQFIMQKRADCVQLDLGISVAWVAATLFLP